MMEDDVRLCALYVYYNDERRLLYIREAADFPVQHFKPDDWRLVMRGVEPPRSGEASLVRCAYYPSWLPKICKRTMSS